MKQEINLNIHIGSHKSFEKEVKLPPNDTFIIEFRYPFDTLQKVKVDTGEEGISTMKLVDIICTKYKEFYKKDKDGSIGIWGHSLGDLYLEGITVDYKTKVIDLHIGS